MEEKYSNEIIYKRATLTTAETTSKKLLVVPGTANEQLTKIVLKRGRKPMKSQRHQQPLRIMLLQS
jgi:hypothetical protein